MHCRSRLIVLLLTGLASAATAQPGLVRSEQASIQLTRNNVNGSVNGSIQIPAFLPGPGEELVGIDARLTLASPSNASFRYRFSGSLPASPATIINVLMQGSYAATVPGSPSVSGDIISRDSTFSPDTSPTTFPTTTFQITATSDLQAPSLTSVTGTYGDTWSTSFQLNLNTAVTVQQGASSGHSLIDQSYRVTPTVSVDYIFDREECPCERTGDEVDVLDLLDFVSAWFGQDSTSDIDADGIPGEIDDLLGFLACWFPAANGGACP